LLLWSLAHRWIIVALCVLVIVSIVSLFMLVGKNFLPEDDESQFQISIRTAEGSTLARTADVVRLEHPSVLGIECLEMTVEFTGVSGP
jgi:hydrophobic/amphiphilic exporter-1 (mainly G- bacteria), HAE1 family